MTRTLDDIAAIKRYLDLDDFCEALDHAPPGIIDERSWGLLECHGRPLSRAAYAATKNSLGDPSI